MFPSQEARARHFLIGCIGVSGKTKWDVLDGVVRRLFKVNTRIVLETESRWLYLTSLKAKYFNESIRSISSV